MSKHNIKCENKAVLLEITCIARKKKLKKQERVCYNHNYCHIEMPNEDNKILKYNHGENSMKAPAITSAD